MLTSQETQAAQEFWKWFEENRLPFEFINSMKPEQQFDLMLRASTALKPYSEDLELQPGSNMVKEGPKYRLIISANGKLEHFAKAKALAELAPTIPDWAIYGLMPPLPKGTQIRFQISSGLLYPSDVWVHLLDSPDDPQFLGLHLALKQFDHCPDEESVQELQSILIQLVAYVIGEESWTMNIQHLQLGPLPDDPMEEGMFELYDLPEQIAAFREGRPGPWEGAKD